MDQLSQPKPLTKKERRAMRRQEKSVQQQQTARKKQTRRIILWALALLACGLGVFGLVKLLSSESGQAISLTDAIDDTDWVKGNKEAQTVLIEYSDFQCPACAHYHPIVKQLTQELADKIVFAYRHFPLRSVHANADLAARAAEAAGGQGKFWEMHDLIFERQEEWSEHKNVAELFKQYAQELDLDQEKFASDLDNQEIKAKVEADYASGLAARVQGTPTFFLNGKAIQNPKTYEAFKQLILQAISASP